jgi:hypothetical protein
MTNHIPPHEALALGIGDPDHLTNAELRAFFHIVHPVEAKHGLRDATLKREAKRYLKNASAQDFLRNALSLSRDRTHIDPKYVAFIAGRINAYKLNTERVHENLSEINAMMKSEYKLDVTECVKNIK